jgi:hypothetical protein
MLDSKLHFHRHLDYLRSQALKLLGLIRFITYNFSSLHSLKVLYITLIRSKLEYASVAWNNLALADSNKLENILKKFASLCYNRFIQSNSFCEYEFMLNYLKFKTLYCRRQNLDALFLISVFKNRTECGSIMDTVGLRVPTKQIKDFSTFKVSMFQDLALQQGTSQLQIASADLWTFLVNTLFQLMIYLLCLTLLRFIIIVLFYCPVLV